MNVFKRIAARYCLFWAAYHRDAAWEPQMDLACQNHINMRNEWYARFDRLMGRKSPGHASEPLTVKGLRTLLDAWELEHNREPMNEHYLGKFEDMPIAVPYYKEVERGRYEGCGVGPAVVLNNPRCLGLEFWQANP